MTEKPYLDGYRAGYGDGYADAIARLADKPTTTAPSTSSSAPVHKPTTVSLHNSTSADEEEPEVVLPAEGMVGSDVAARYFDVSTSTLANWRHHRPPVGPRYSRLGPDGVGAIRYDVDELRRVRRYVQRHGTLPKQT